MNNVILAKTAEIEQITNLDGWIAFSQKGGFRMAAEHCDEFYAIEKQKFDPKTPEGRKGLKDLGKEINSLVKKFTDARMAVTKPSQDEIKSITSANTEFSDMMAKTREEVLADVTAYEKAEKERKASAEAFISLAKSYRQPVDEFGVPLSSTQVQQRMDTLMQECMCIVTLGDFVDIATAEHKATLSYLDDLLRNTQDAEQEAAGLERLRQEAAERDAKEAQIKREAEIAAKATADAEAAAKDQVERAEREAEQAKREAAAQAAKAVEDEKRRAEAEAKQIADAQAKADAEAAAKAANVEHQREINRKVIQALLGLGLNEDQAKSVLVATVKGQIPHISITY